MIIYRCHVGPCTRQATSTLTVTDHHGDTYSVTSCGVHVNSLTTYVTNRTGEAPTQRSATAPQETSMTTTLPHRPASAEIPRDRWMRPLVVPPGGGRPAPYTRCTSYVSCLEDTYNLGRWMQRMVATGLAQRPDLMLAVSAHHDDKKRMDGICDQAREAATASAAATTGTALHALCERLDRGQQVGVIPDAYKPDLDAYTTATAGFAHIAIEEFMVLDELRIGGTPDRIVRLPDGRIVIADIKTGSIEWGMGKIAMQLAVYSRSVRYDHVSGNRRNRTGPDLDQDVAVVIHLPAGTGRATLVEVDIAAGWEAVQLATQVRVWRKRRDLSWPLHRSGLGLEADFPDVLTRLIADSTTVDQLQALWPTHHADFTDRHIQLARERIAQLTS